MPTGYVVRKGCWPDKKQTGQDMKSCPALNGECAYSRDGLPPGAFLLPRVVGGVKGVLQRDEVFAGFELIKQFLFFLELRRAAQAISVLP